MTETSVTYLLLVRRAPWIYKKNIFWLQHWMSETSADSNLKGTIIWMISESIWVKIFIHFWDTDIFVSELINTIPERDRHILLAKELKWGQCYKKQSFFLMIRKIIATNKWHICSQPGSRYKPTSTWHKMSIFINVLRLISVPYFGSI